MTLDELKTMISSRIKLAFSEADINSYFGQSAKNEEVENKLKEDIFKLLDIYDRGSK